MNPERDYYAEVVQIIQEARLLEKVVAKEIPSLELIPALTDFLAISCLIEGQRNECGDEVLIEMAKRLLENLRVHGGGNISINDSDDEPTFSVN